MIGYSERMHFVVDQYLHGVREDEPAVGRIRWTWSDEDRQYIAEGTGDVAVSETYGTAVHWGSPVSDPRRNFTSGFRYVDHFEKRDGRWAIAERWAVREWTRSEADRFMAKEGDGPSPRRDHGDPVFTLKARLGLD